MSVEDWRELDRGALEEEDAIASFSRRAGRPVEEIRKLMTLTLEELDPIPGSFEMLDYLGGLGLNLYCLSNMSSKTLNYLQKRYDFWDKFQGVVISGEVKSLKPEPEIFLHLLTRYGLAARETVFIDDQPVNVVGAEAVGMRGIWFTNAQDCRIQMNGLL